MNLPNILKVIRLHIVAGGFLAFSLGALLAASGGTRFNLLRFVFGYAAVFLGDLSTHYSNDYFDVAIDKLAEKRKLFAGSRILVSNPYLIPLSKQVSLVLLAGSNILAFAFVVFSYAPLEFFIVMFIASVVGWFYSAPPARLVSRGIGELAVAFVTGFAIPGLGYLAIRGQFDFLFFCFAIPFTMYGLILSLSLHAPDFETDQMGGKGNLVVRLGQPSVFFLILAMASLATFMFCFYAWQNVRSVVDFDVAVLLSIIPLIAALLGFVCFSKRKEVNRSSALNIIALFVFNILMIFYLLIVLFA